MRSFSIWLETGSPRTLNELMKICLDAGHGGNDSGAVGQSGLNESDVVLAITKLVEALLLTGDYEVLLTRTEDVYVALDRRCYICNAWQSNYFVSIHCNSDGPTAKGIETLYKTEAGLELAIPIQDALVAITDDIDRSVKKRDDLAVLNGTSCPAILAEVGFISHPETEAKLATDDYKDLIAEAIVLGITQFFSTGSVPDAA